MVLQYREAPACRRRASHVFLTGRKLANDGEEVKAYFSANFSGFFLEKEAHPC